MADSYTGPGIWIRVVHRFRPRMPEWMAAVIMTFWGLTLMLPDPVFENAAYAFFSLIFDEWWLGLSIAIIGGVRLAGLIINGARKKVTPWIRVLSACIGFLLFAGIVFCFVSSGVYSVRIRGGPPC